MKKNKTQIIAHRGGAALWTENSLEAIQEVLKLDVNGEKVDGVEVDVHFSADHQVYVFHDETLDRCSNGSGKIHQQRQKELSKLILPNLLHKDGAHSGPIPKLDHYISKMKAGHGVLSIELKDKNGGEAYQYLAKVVVNKLREEGVLERSFIHAFQWSYLPELLALGAKLACAANVSAHDIQKHGSLEKILDVLDKMNVREINIDHRLMNEDMVIKVHQRGFRITLWTVNEIYDLRRFIQAGVESIATDRPDLALKVRQELAN